MNTRCKHDWNIRFDCAQWQVALCRKCNTYRELVYDGEKVDYLYIYPQNMVKTKVATRISGKRARRNQGRGRAGI